MLDRELLKKKLLMVKDLQYKLNVFTNGKEFIHTGISKNGKPAQWLKCIFTETAEAFEWDPYKHWKDVNRKPQVDNFLMELVDNLHFSKSMFIQFEETALRVTETSYAQEEINNTIIDEVLNTIENLMIEDATVNPVVSLDKVCDFLDIDVLSKVKHEYREDYVIEQLLYRYVRQSEAFYDLACINNFYTEEYKLFATTNILEDDYEITYILNSYIKSLINLILVWLIKSKKPMEQFVNLYLAKNVLNEVRQNNGYKEGTYVKMWKCEAGVIEDNEYAINILNTSAFHIVEDYREALDKEAKRQIKLKKEEDNV